MPRKNQPSPANSLRMPGAQRDRHRDRARPGGERDGQRKQRDVLQPLGRGGLFLLTLLTLLRRIQQVPAAQRDDKPAGDPQRRQGDAEERQHIGPGPQRAHHHAQRVQRRPAAPAAPGSPAARLAVTLRKMNAPLIGLTMENSAGKPSRKALTGFLHGRSGRAWGACRPRAGSPRTPPRPAARPDRRSACRRSAGRPAARPAVKPHGTLAAGFQDMLNG